ncbi:MAG: hypothetical protein IKS52_04900, partial [Clostridia bacterium]|nr:hypothetical protein [Clostridia bacterium]
MKQTLRKILSALVALTLLVLVVPALSGHTASAATTVTSVAITGIDAPVAGAKPDYTASGSGTGYYVEDDYTKGTEWRNGVEWYDVTAKKWLAADTSTFIAGHQYKVVVSVKAKSGYTFSKSQSKGTINGKAAEVFAVWSSDNAGFAYTFPAAATPISSVAITGVTAPAAGAKPVFSATANGTGYQKQNYNSASYHNGVLWRDTSNDNKVLTADDTFVAGHKYEVIVCVEPKAGYEFNDSTTGTINGKSASGKNIYTDGTATFNYTFPAVAAADTLITGVTITGIDAPAAGAKPDYTASGSGAGYAVESDYNSGDWKNGVIWYDVTAKKYLSSTDTFIAGHQYKVEVSVIAKSGYIFTLDSTATINGKTAKVESVYTSENAGFSYTFPVFAAASASGTLVSKVTITSLTEPVAGDWPDYSVTVSGEGYTLKEYGYAYSLTWNQGVIWRDVTENRDMNYDDPFQAGHKYRVGVKLEPEDGYTFKNGSGAIVTPGTIDGNAVTKTESSDGTSVIYYYTFQDLATVTPITSYDITGSGRLSINEINGEYWKNGILWRDETEDRDMRFYELFELGHE